VSIHDALSSSTLRWRAVRGARPGYDLVDGDEALAVARQGEVEIGERLYRTQAQRGGSSVLVDLTTGSRVATIRPMAHGPAAMSVGRGRYRMTKQGVLPFALEVTADFGGPQVLEMLHVGPLFRVRAGDDMATVPAADVDLLTVLSGMRVLDLLAPTVPVAA
jgi:hypothetical protein